MTKDKPVVHIRPMKYQPTKAEREADMSIDTTPDKLADALLRPVTVKVIGKDD